MSIKLCKEALQKVTLMDEFWCDFLRESGKGKYTSPMPSHWEKFIEYLEDKSENHAAIARDCLEAQGPTAAMEEIADDVEDAMDAAPMSMTDLLNAAQQAMQISAVTGDPVPSEPLTTEHVQEELAEFKPGDIMLTQIPSDAIQAGQGIAEAFQETMAQAADQESASSEELLAAEEVLDANLSVEPAQDIYRMIASGLKEIGALDLPSKPSSTIVIKRQDVPDVSLTGPVPSWFERALKLLSVNQEVMLVGPSGCGKSFTSRQLAEALHLPFYSTSFSAGVDESILQGWLMPIMAGGQFVYVPSVWVNAFENGGLMLIDELDAGDANMALIINDGVANGEFFIPMRHENPVVRRHKDFRLIVAANTWGHGADRKYIGRNQLDEATLSRFRMGQVAIDFDPELERNLYDARVVEYGHALRERCRSQTGWTRDVSTRDIAKANAKLAQWDNAEEVYYDFFSDWAEKDLERICIEVSHVTQKAILN